MQHGHGSFLPWHSETCLLEFLKINNQVLYNICASQRYVLYLLKCLKELSYTVVIVLPSLNRSKSWFSVYIEKQQQINMINFTKIGFIPGLWHYSVHSFCRAGDKCTRYEQFRSNLNYGAHSLCILGNITWPLVMTACKHWRWLTHLIAHCPYLEMPAESSNSMLCCTIMERALAAISRRCSQQQVGPAHASTQDTCLQQGAVWSYRRHTSWTQDEWQWGVWRRVK